MYCGSDSCYENLGLGRSADAPAIKKAHRKLSLQWRPDRYPENAELATAKSQKIATAYAVLSDAALREAYDYFLDHPDERLYNKLRYYRIAYIPAWAGPVLLGLVALVSCGQFYHSSERANAFQQSPEFAKILVEEYVRHCTRGRHGYQTGELTPAKKAEIKAAFLEQLSEDPEVPFALPRWSNTVIPTVVYHAPLKAFKWLEWRMARHKVIEEENAREEEERRKLEQEEQERAQEKARLVAEREAKRAKQAAFLAERQKKEQEMKARWAEEARREAEEEARREEEEEEDEEQAASRKVPAGEESLIVQGRVSSVEELRKKGHFLVQVAYGGGSVQLVVDRTVEVGQKAEVALEGAAMPDGKVAKRSKVAGEWSEGVLLELGAAPARPAAAAPAEEAAVEEEELPSAGAGDAKARQRRKKQKG